MKSKQRNAYLLKKYGITLKQYNAKLKEQGGKCAICKKPAKQFSRSLATDHNHKSGRVRGLLCFYCNKFRVGRATLESAKLVYEYLLKYEGGQDEAGK